MSRGHDRERQVKALEESEGWFVMRAPASLGIADLVMLRAIMVGLGTLAEARLVEVKSESYPYNHFGPARRRELSTAARAAGATAWLYSWPSRGSLQRIPEEEWPS